MNKFFMMPAEVTQMELRCDAPFRVQFDDSPSFRATLFHFASLMNSKREGAVLRHFIKIHNYPINLSSLLNIFEEFCLLSSSDSKDFGWINYSFGKVS